MEEHLLIPQYSHLTFCLVELQEQLDQFDLFELLPPDLQREVLQDVDISTRATCQSFRSCIDGLRASLTLSPRQVWGLGVDGLNTIQSHGGVRDLEDLRGLLGRLGHLKTLTVTQCDAELLEVIALPHLTELDLSNSSYLQNLDALSHCQSLTSVNLNGCDALHDLYGLANCLGLKKLVLSNCNTLIDIRALGSCAGLEALGLVDCMSLIDIRPLETCTSLIALDLNECIALCDISHWRCAPASHFLTSAIAVT